MTTGALRTVLHGGQAGLFALLRGHPILGTPSGFRGPLATVGANALGPTGIAQSPVFDYGLGPDIPIGRPAFSHATMALNRPLNA